MARACVQWIQRPIGVQRYIVVDDFCTFEKRNEYITEEMQNIHLHRYDVIQPLKSGMLFRLTVYRPVLCAKSMDHSHIRRCSVIRNQTSLCQLKERPCDGLSLVSITWVQHCISNFYMKDIDSAQTVGLNLMVFSACKHTTKQSVTL